MELDTIVCGDCLDVMATIPNQSADAVITDPPYPCIKRDYGYWTVEEWWKLIVEGVIPEVRRILKPTGSAVFILQPNSEKVGKLRGWLWEFMAWICQEWNMIQDVWWWNSSMLPTVHCSRKYGLMRPSVKSCVWCGPSNCFRNQQEVLWTESAQNAYLRTFGNKFKSVSSHYVDQKRCASVAAERGGTTPFNLIPLPNTDGTSIHGASTPMLLIDWWIRYIVPHNGLVIDPFMGSGTTAVAALKLGRHFYGCDINPDYIKLANERIEKTKLEMAQLNFLSEQKEVE